MATTIQVSAITKQLLETLKDRQHSPTYDKVILELVQERMGVQRSMFGAAKGMRWTKRDRGTFREL